MDARARSLAPVLGADADLLEANAWLHDIGYAPGLAVTGLHALDGARYLRDAQHADAMLCRLVAHHSCAIIDAGERVGSIQHREGPGPRPSHAAPGQILLAAAGVQASTQARGVRERLAPEHAVMRGMARVFASRRLYEAAQKAGRLAQWPLVRDGKIRRLPGALGGWTAARDLPPVPPQSFRDWWRERS